MSTEQLSENQGIIQSPQPAEDHCPISENSEKLDLQQLQAATEFFNKTQALQSVLEADLLACDAKWTLFVAAALSYRYDSKLKPFPSRFNQEQTGHNIDALVSVINDTPKLKVILQHIVEHNFEELDIEVVELLYWVLIEHREPSLRAVNQDEVNVLLETVQDKKVQRKPTHVFEVHAPVGCYTDEEVAENVKLAFYGQTLDSYYSLIQNGFSYNHSQEPISLSTDLLTSLKKSPNGAAWGASQCGSLISCTALCEFAYDTSVDKITPNRRNKSCFDIELNNSKNIRLRYLLFYGSRFPYERKPRQHGLKAWIYRHKYGLSLAMYLLLLASFEVANSGSGRSIKVYISNKIDNLLEIFKKSIAME